MKIILPLLISILVAVFIYNQPQPPLLTTMVYPDAKLLADFELVDHHQQSFTNQQLMGKWSVLFFGFTYCPDICPTTMSMLSQIAKKLDPEILQQLQFVFVSVDPERDTLERLAQYISFYHPDFIAVTGDQQQLHPFALSLGAMYMKVPTENTYTISHSGTLFIVNPKGQRFGIFSKSANGTFDAVAMTQDLTTIINSN